MPERILGYDQKLDFARYQNLREQRVNLAPQEFTRRKKQLDLGTGHNIETALGERFNLAISRIDYYIEDGQLISPEHDEPFLEVTRRGQKYRQENGSRDINREKAEVEGFAKVQKILTDPTYQDAKIIVISPRGKSDSMYQHNFFDLYQRRGNQVIMYRFASKSSWRQFAQVANGIDPFNALPENPNDADFIANPLITYKDTPEILALANLDKEAMREEEYQKLIETVNALKLNYIATLAMGNFEDAQKIFIATLNFADEIVLKTKDRIVRNQLLGEKTAAIIAAYSLQQPRPVLAGCGLQQVLISQSPSQFISSLFPYSVSEFANNSCPECSQGENHFHCPRCKGQIESGHGITTCPHCGLTKEAAGSTC